MTMTQMNRSIPEVFSDLIGQLTTLLRKEGQLARSEISEKIASAVAGLGFVVAGAALAIPAVVIILEGIVAALVRTGMAVYWSAFLVGGITLVVGLFMLMSGMKRLKAGNLVPEKTIHQLQQDAQVAKQEVSTSHEHHRAA